MEHLIPSRIYKMSLCEFYVIAEVLHRIARKAKLCKLLIPVLVAQSTSIRKECEFFN